MGLTSGRCNDDAVKRDAAIVISPTGVPAPNGSSALGPGSDTDRSFRELGSPQPPPPPRNSNSSGSAVVLDDVPPPPQLVRCRAGVEESRRWR